MRHRRSLMLALTLALLCALPPAQAAEPHGTPEAGTPAVLGDIPAAARAKIDPRLLEQLLDAQRTAATQLEPVARRKPATYLVHLRERATLQDLARVPLLAERRRLLVQRLQATASRSQAGVVALLEQGLSEGRITRYQSYWIFNGLAVDGDLATAIELALRPEVEAIRPNRVHRLPDPRRGREAIPAAGEVEWNIAKIGADRVWESFGITGQGIVVANMDSGVDWTHPALQRKYRGYNAANPAASDHDYNWFDPTGTYPDQPGPREYVGPISDHGTHVMGIMVGSEPDGSECIGVAPGAQWIAIKVFDDYGQSDDEWIHAGFQWCLAPKDLNGENPDPTKAPDIVNNSWGDPDGMDEAFRQDIDALRQAGIFCTFAAGNHGPDTGTAASPGSLSNAFAVGATTAYDSIAYFSSRGPSPWGQLKPEVVAPGAYSIRSSVAGGGYESDWMGTSMAAPHVAGLAALLWQADRQSATPSLTIAATEQVITSTALDLGTPGPDNTYGYGRTDAHQAVADVLLDGSSKVAQPRRVVSGQALTYTVRLVNRGSITVTGAALVDALPAEVTYITGTLSGEGVMCYEQDSHRVLWQGSLPPHPAAVTITCRVLANDDLPANTTVVNTATLSVGGETVASLSAQVLVNPGHYVRRYLFICRRYSQPQPTIPHPAAR